MFFRGRPIQRCHLGLHPTDPRCHVNETWVKIGYNSACVRDIFEILASNRRCSWSGYWTMSVKFCHDGRLLPRQRNLGQPPKKPNPENPLLDARIWDICHISWVIANFDPNFVAMTTRVRKPDMRCRMVTWPMTSHDPKRSRSWPQNPLGSLSP